MNVFVVVRVHVAVGVLVELDVDPVACVQRVHQHHGVRRRLGLAPRTAAVGVQRVRSSPVLPLRVGYHVVVDVNVRPRAETTLL